MFNLKKLMTVAVIATTTLTVAPVVLADDDDDDRRVYKQKATPAMLADDDDDDDDRRIYQQNKAQYISKQKAIQIAKNRVKNSQVKKAKFDHDNGVATYKVELRTKSGVEYDVKINAKTGKIIDVDND